MHGQQREPIESAVQILRQALGRSGETRVDTPEVRLALRNLWDHCPERWPLITFWEAACQRDEFGQSRSLEADFICIVRQVEQITGYSDIRPTSRVRSSERDL
jgi:hypothetical protein